MRKLGCYCRASIELCRIQLLLKEQHITDPAVKTHVMKALEELVNFIEIPA